MEEKRKMPLSLYGLSKEDLTTVLSLERPYEARQISRWLVKGASSFGEMSDLSKAERERLSLLMPSFCSSAVVKESREGETIKLALKLHDSSIIECVLLSDGKGRNTACLSSQVGCAMRCAFCRTGTMGLVRNLAAEEIIEQFIHLSRLKEISHIVFMGMGEPLANLKAVLKAISSFHEADGFNISLRKITISTCGLSPAILKLAELKLPVKLAVSLVSADNDTRDRVMPINKRFPLPELKNAVTRFQRATGKRFTFEYCMLSGVNISEGAARKLAAYTKDLDVIVNLIPYNEAAELPWKTPNRNEILRFTRALDRLGVPYTIRMSKGGGINGACGQLATKTRREREKSGKEE